MIIHLHIPKTGGTSVRHLLSKNYEEGFYGLKPMAKDDPLWKKNKDDRNWVTCLSGHMVYGVNLYFNQTSEYIVFLRDPVERILSLYHYLWVRNAHRRPPDEAGMTLLDFVQSNRWACNDNDQVRFLAGTPHRGGNPRTQNVDEKVYFQAITNLQNCKFVGLTESLQTGINVLATRLGWKYRTLGWSLKSDRTLHAEDLSREVRMEIEQRNRYDRWLYGAASEIWEKQCVLAG